MDMRQISNDSNDAAKWRAFLAYAQLPRDTTPDVAANRLQGAEAALEAERLYRVTLQALVTSYEEAGR